MIRSLEIKNLRGIREGKLDDFTPLVILVGPNGCGKSTILDALLIGASPNPGDAIGLTVRRRFGVQYGAPWLFWRSDRNTSADIRVTTYDLNARNHHLRLDPQSPTAKVMNTIYDGLVQHGQFKGFPGSNKIEVEFQPGNHYRHSGNYSSLTGISAVQIVDMHTDELQTPLHQLVTEAIKQGRRKEIKEILAEIVPGLSDIPILTEGDAPLVYLEFEDHAVPVALAGDGVHALLRLSLELASSQGGVALLEEPEAHLHPAAIRQSARAILAAIRRDIQVILTTHSLELIDALLSEMRDDEEQNRLSVYGMKLQDGCLRSYRLTGSEAALMRFQIEEDLR